MFKIEIADTDLHFDCAPDDTIMRAGLRAGLGMPYECNVGSCGTCKAELIDGSTVSVSPDAPALTDRDRERNRFLGCQSRPTADCRIKLRLETKYQTGFKPRRFSATLSSTHDITHDIREFRFTVPPPTGFRAGQYALIRLPGLDKPRAYSMSNIDDGSGEWHFQVRRVPGGQGSTALFDALPLKATVDIDGPYGLAYLRSDCPRDIVCIAGGSGLSPAVSIARGAACEPLLNDRQVHFFYGGRGPADICGEEHLRELPGFGVRFHYHSVISMPELDVDKSWQGRVGFVHELVHELMAHPLSAYEYYVAGPPPMVKAVQRMLIQNKVPLSQIHYDSFY